MNEKNTKLISEENGFQALAWLTDALDITGEYASFTAPAPVTDRPSAAFHQKCRESAEIAFTVAKIRKETERVGFVPLSLSAYVEGVARMLSVSLAPVFKWVGVKDLSRLSDESAAAIARFAKKIGISRGEMLVHTRISLAEQMGYAPASLMLARRTGDDRRSELEESELMMAEWEAELSMAERDKVRRVISIISEEF